MILELLDKLRKGISGCEVLVFVDIASRTVLSVSATKKTPQEDLDAYCAAAAELLDGDTGQAVAQIESADDEAQLFDAVVVSGDQSLFFQRSKEEPAEALICVCSAPADVAEVSRTMRQGFDQISAEK